MAKYVVTLYLVGQTFQFERLAADLPPICESDLGGEYKLAVADVPEDPELALAERILATPTAVKSLPESIRTLIADQSRERVLGELGLTETQAQSVVNDGRRCRGQADRRPSWPRLKWGENER